ncbi:hypothetical protein AKJ16_DCAP26159, partial [Drosera capensis]
MEGDKETLLWTTATGSAKGYAQSARDLSMMTLTAAGSVITTRLLTTPLARLAPNTSSVSLVAKVLFGCSADEFFDFATLHPFA